MAVAPIVIFCYNRPWHLTQTLNALKANVLADISHVHIFRDGPKHGVASSDLGNIEEVGRICSNLKGFASVSIHKNEANKGLQNSVIDGLDRILKNNESVIVVEDDVVTSPYFLQFMNEALVQYKNEKKVLSIGSWNYFYKTKDNFFNHMPDTIAWATWRDRWGLFEADGNALYNKLQEKHLVTKFNLGGTFDFEKMLKMQIEEKVSSWAIRWTAVAVLNDTLTLYPKVSLSKHIGFGNDSTNCEGDDYNKNLQLANENISDFSIPVWEDEESVKAWLHIENVIKKSSLYIGEPFIQKKENIFQRIKRKIKSFKRKEVKEEKRYGWAGDYTDWEEVLSQTTGYDKSLIVEKVKESLLKVKAGQVAFERDSVAFQELQYSEALLTTFKKIADKENKELNLLDFGGSLGSIYYQYRKLLNDYKIKWGVVEQEHFVSAGKEFFENEELHFFKDIEACVQNQKPQVLLLSSVLAYLREPHAFLKEVQKYGFKYIILYRTAFIEGNKDLLTLQTVPPQIYEASYPSWFFNEEKLLNGLKENYAVMDTFKGDIETELMLNNKKAYWKGIVLKLK